MTVPRVTEVRVPLEPVTQDPFVRDLKGLRRDSIEATTPAPPVPAGKA